MKNILLVGTLFLTIGANRAQACSLVQIDAEEVRSRMLAALGDHLGVAPSMIPRSVLTTPELKFLLPLEANCDGLHSAHHASAFKLRYQGCSISGIAVVLGYTTENAVAVNSQWECPSNPSRNGARSSLFR